MPEKSPQRPAGKKTGKSLKEKRGGQGRQEGDQAAARPLTVDPATLAVPSHLAARLLAAVDRHGVLLVHDQVLPSITAIATGGPVTGSWWSHPMANAIYDALGEIDDDVLRVKLVAQKDTLIARRLWSAVVAIGSARRPWQVDDLDDSALALLASIDVSGEPVVPVADRHAAGRTLAARLLVVGTQIHMPDGHHVTAFEGWTHWADRHAITPADPDEASAGIAAIVAVWPASGRRRLLPW